MPQSRKQLIGELWIVAMLGLEPSPTAQPESQDVASAAVARARPPLFPCPVSPVSQPGVPHAPHGRRRRAPSQWPPAGLLRMVCGEPWLELLYHYVTSLANRSKLSRKHRTPGGRTKSKRHVKQNMRVVSCWSGTKTTVTAEKIEKMRGLIFFLPSEFPATLASNRMEISSTHGPLL